MGDFDCTTDPTIVACTGEDLGREYDQPVTTEVGTVAPSWTAPTELGHTGVPVAPYLGVALLLILTGRTLMLGVKRRA